MKWFGKIAFSNLSETEPGTWEDEPIERDYFGDISKMYKRSNDSSTINPDLTLSNQLSVVADPFLLDSFDKILYVTFMNSKWKVDSVELQYPRMTLSFGGLYKKDNE